MKENFRLLLLNMMLRLPFLLIYFWMFVELFEISVNNSLQISLFIWVLNSSCGMTIDKIRGEIKELKKKLE